VVIDFSNSWHYNPHRYGSKEFFERLEKNLESEIREFDEFIRDHRSRDYYRLEVVREYKNYCKFCGYEFPDGFNGIADCCDAMLEAQNIDIVERNK